MLADIDALKIKYANAPVTFIGVYSPKFENEKQSHNVRHALLRHEIRHPVVNDPEHTMWHQLGIRSWPTFVVVGPKGNMLFSVSGEGHRETADTYIKSILSFYEPSEFNETPLSLSLEANESSLLLYPGKVAIDSEGKRLMISDFNHNRILVTTLEGQMLEVIGSGERGFADGPYSEAAFFHPQGLAYHRDTLYVADTRNHAIRRIDLLTKQVSTIAGNGCQGRDYRGGHAGKDQVLSSPWDLTLGPQGDRLFIAMAGTHQIWMHELFSGRTRTFSGSGEEKNFNSDNLLLSGWAQPSGITYGDDHLYIADSESSSVRTIDLADHSSATLAGGDNQDSDNLFCYGDKDGQGSQARLQRPLGIAWISSLRKILIADTYNHRLKLLDPKSNTITSFACNGTPGCKDGPPR